MKDFFKVNQPVLKQFFFFKQLYFSFKYDFNTTCFCFIVFYFYLNQAAFINLCSLLQICLSNNVDVNIQVIYQVIY